MPRTKKYASSADRLREFRKRQRAEKAAEALPTAEQIKERDAANETVTQLARAAGVPRGYPLSVWKRAAQALIEGEGRVQDKVKALRTLCAGDKDWRKKVADWVKSDSSEAAKKFIAAQGWTIADGAKPQSLVDRMVACLEAGKRLEDHFTAEELNSPAPPDPVHDKLWADYQRYKDTGKLPGADVTHLCDQCGGPVTRQIGKAWYCDRHDGTPTRPPIEAPAFPASPAEYINSDFGKAPTQSRLDLAQQGQAALQAANARAQRPDFGPMPDTYVTSAGGFEKKKRD